MPARLDEGKRSHQQWRGWGQGAGVGVGIGVGSHFSYLSTPFVRILHLRLVCIVFIAQFKSRENGLHIKSMIAVGGSDIRTVR
jgi:hypothetical protein